MDTLCTSIVPTRFQISKAAPLPPILFFWEEHLLERLWKVCCLEHERSSPNSDELGTDFKQNSGVLATKQYLQCTYLQRVSRHKGLVTFLCEHRVMSAKSQTMNAKRRMNDHNVRKRIHFVRAPCKRIGESLRRRRHFCLILER